MSNPQSPIVNAGLLYVNGLNIQKFGSTGNFLTVFPGAARDSTNTNDIILDTSLTINGNNTGVNGIDLGNVLPNTSYAVYIIGDSTDYQSTAALLSDDTSQPNLPSNYDMYRRIGWVRTDDNSNILKFYQFGTNEERSYYYDLPIFVLTGGISVSFTPLALEPSVPSIDTEVLFLYGYTPAAVSNTAQFLPFGSTATTGIIRVGSGVAALQTGMVTVPCGLNSGIAEILYRVSSSDTLNLSVVGFKDFLS